VGARAGTVALGDRGGVPRVGFGGAWLTGPGTFGPPADLGLARQVIRRAAAAGVRLFDTADSYGPQISEELIAAALHPYDEDIVISTKGGRHALGDNRWRADGRPEHLRAACEASLRRLRLEAIDLYQLNAVDPDVPIAESLGALLELRAAGKVRAIGICNVDVDQLEAALAVAPIASVQDRFDVRCRDHEPVLDACTRLEIPFLPWFPPWHDEAAPAASPLARVAERHGAKPAQVGLAWLLARSPLTVPLPGGTDPAAFEEDLEALAIELDPEEMRELRG
jgi:aryl-alcohol dehydrogenase-like predicted oxidoreductase